MAPRVVATYVKILSIHSDQKTHRSQRRDKGPRDGQFVVSSTNIFTSNHQSLISSPASLTESLWGRINFGGFTAFSPASLCQGFFPDKKRKSRENCRTKLRLKVWQFPRAYAFFESFWIFLKMGHPVVLFSIYERDGDEEKDGEGFGTNLSYTCAFERLLQAPGVSISSFQFPFENRYFLWHFPILLLPSGLFSRVCIATAGNRRRWRRTPNAAWALHSQERRFPC